MRRRGPKSCSQLFYCTFTLAHCQQRVGIWYLVECPKTGQRSNGLRDATSPQPECQESSLFVQFKFILDGFNVTVHICLYRFLQVLNQTSLTRVCEEAVKAAGIDVLGCVPSGSSSAGLIIRPGRRMLLMVIGVFYFYCIKVSIDSWSSHANGVYTKRVCGKNSRKEISLWEEWLDCYGHGLLVTVFQKKNILFLKPYTSVRIMLSFVLGSCLFLSTRERGILRLHWWQAHLGRMAISGVFKAAATELYAVLN